MRVDFKSPRKWSFPLNIILFNLCRLWPFRQKDLWIFGAWEGKKYDDNAKYLYQYVCKQHPKEVRAVWLTDSIDAINQINMMGCEAYLNKSWKGKWLQLRAGVALYTNGLIDFGVFPLVGGAELVALWHGMGFKRIYNGKYSGISLRAKKLLDHLFSWTQRDLTPVTSSHAARWVSEMFTLKKSEIFITGQPRNDAFKGLDKADVLKNTHIDISKRIILYMPTYRNARMGPKAMEKIVNELYYNENLNKWIKETNSVFVVKLHPLTPNISLCNHENFSILSYNEVQNNQELLGVADILVTDYSSCFIDYALLNRPIVFYTPDEKLFFEYSETVDKEFFDIERLCQAANPEGLKDALEISSTIVADATNALFEDKSIRGTCYSENVYRVIAKKIGL